MLGACTQSDLLQPCRSGAVVASSPSSRLDQLRARRRARRGAGRRTLDRRLCWAHVRNPICCNRAGRGRSSPPAPLRGLTSFAHGGVLVVVPDEGRLTGDYAGRMYAIAFDMDTAAMEAAYTGPNWRYEI